MKLPKGFGGQGFGGALQQAQQAMARAQNLEKELATERVEHEKDGVKVVFDGTGDLQSLSIDPELVDPEDVAGLESVIVAAIRQGFAKASEMRSQRMQDIMPDIPGLGGLGL
ncbi:MAG: YbaB/EbfC family nucleoid-associated protein [Fimbriimonadaceae bacterium]|nr:YbaB/EbfC family nucleoid-associated protein [Fimbriimonadaceae bacterium]